jgi:FkbM family methyltransferase
MKRACVREHTFIPGLLGPEPVVLDLGANRGDFSAELFSRHGARCFVVEANPVLAARLKEDARFRAWECAVAATGQPMPFHIAHNDEGSSLLQLPPRNLWGRTLSRTVEVRARTLDSIAADLPAGRIDLVKMDVEGAEVEVLGSASRETLRRIGQVTVEFHSDPQFDFDLATGVEAAIRRLRREGFMAIDFSSGRRLDVLFLNVGLLGLSRWAAWGFVAQLRAERSLGWLWHYALPGRFRPALEPLARVVRRAFRA